MLFFLALSRIGEADDPGPACATAKLFGAQFDAIGQWAANLTVRECRQFFSKRFEKESYLETSSVCEDIHGTHSHMDRFLLPASPEPEGDLAHTQQIRDYLPLLQVGDERDGRRHVSAPLQIGDMSGKELSNHFLSSREQRRTQSHWKETQNFQRCVECPPMQRGSLERTRQALHSHFRF